jgi:ATP-dependent RNA helicase RhlE
MDEEGFMMDIERFTKQEIPVQPIEGFGPEEGEIAEPIAMGRQTLWGGAGKPPSRDVMQAAAKAARQEMMERIRSNKTPNGGRGGRRPAAADAQQGEAEGEAQQRPARQHKPRSNNRVNSQRSQGQQAVERGERNSDRGAERNGERSNSFGPSDRAPRPRATTISSALPSAAAPASSVIVNAATATTTNPRADAHLGTQQGHARHNGARGSNAGGQPDPMRTSVDSMADRGRRGGFGGGRGGFGGGNRGGNRGGFGGGYGR